MVPQPQVAPGRSDGGNWLWYAKRAKVMGPREIGWRAMEQVHLLTLRMAYRVGRVTGSGINRCVVRNPGDFAFCSAETPQLPALRWSLEMDEAERGAMLEGRLRIPGASWIWQPDEEVWHRAPDSGRRWPHTFFDGIDHRPGNPTGDVRLAWEPARLQHLIALALLAGEASVATREQAVRLIEAQLCSWVAANPVLTGIHYISMMECALRILAVCHALDLTRTWLSAPHSVWQTALSLVESHGHLIAARISAHSSRGNHTVAEGAGLVYAGLLFPELPRASAWLAQGLQVLEDASSHLMHVDGGGCEQALWYHRFLADLYGLVARVLAHRCHEIPPAIRDAHEQAARFLSEFADTADHLPRIGDGDQGYALSPLLRLSSRPACRSGLKTLPSSGYSIIRLAEEKPVTLVFDHGPLGLPPCYGHGHADALSIVLKLGNREVLVDPGTYSYADPRWRTYFRGTRAHNTVTVDGLDQAVQESAFLWSRPYTTTLHRRVVEDGAVTLLACHDGYRFRAGVMHWRGVHVHEQGRWVIWDYLTGTGEHELELHWHIAGRVDVADNRVTVNVPDRSLDIRVEGGMTTLHSGETAPIRGWQAPSYGVLEPITTVRVACRTSLPHEFVTTFAMDDGVEGADSFTAVLASFRRWVHETETSGSARRSG